METYLDYGNFFRVSRGAGRGSEISHTNESKTQVRRKQSFVVEEKKETSIS